MSSAPAGIRIAQTVGITTAGFVAGGTLCISYYHIPSLLLAPNSLIVRQWRHSFDVGMIAHPAIALVSTIAYGYLAYQMKGTLDQHKAELYGICVASNLMIWPWTMIVMMPTIKKLFRRFDELEGLSETEEVIDAYPKGESSKELIDWWSTLNVVRAGFLLFAAGLGAWATVD